MEAYANSTIVVKESSIRSLELPAFTEFKDKLNDLDVDLFEYASCIEDFHTIEEIDEEEHDELDKVYARFREQFKNRTSMNIYLSYHESEYDSDEVDGAFFHLSFSEVFETSIAAKNLEEAGVDMHLSFFVSGG